MIHYFSEIVITSYNWVQTSQVTEKKITAMNNNKDKTQSNSQVGYSSCSEKEEKGAKHKDIHIGSAVAN